MEVSAVKGSLTVIAGFLMYIAGMVNEIIVVLVFFMFLDLITGLLRAYLTKTLNSTLGIAGVIKKFAIFVMVGMAGGIEYIIASSGQNSGGLVLLSVTSFFVVNEGLSVLENCAQIGLPIPPILYNALEKLHRDPSGKEKKIERHPDLDRVDKKELLKEIEILEEKKKEEKQNG